MTKRDQLEALRATALDRKGEALDQAAEPDTPPRPRRSRPEPPPAEPGPTAAKRRRAPRKSTKSARPGAEPGELPPPARRIHRAEDEDIQRMAVDLPAEIEPYRETAKAAGLTKSHLLLSVIEAHGPALRDQATDGQALLPFTGAGPRVRWLLEFSPAEHQIVVDLIDEIGPAMPRKKNAAVIGLLMARAAGLH